jgi:hypothetical protein
MSSVVSVSPAYRLSVSLEDGLLGSGNLIGSFGRYVTKEGSQMVRSQSLFLLALLMTVTAAPLVADSVYIDESGPAGSLPVVTLQNDPGSTFLQSSTVTPVTCDNPAVLSGCWIIDVRVIGQGLLSWGTQYGVELTEPGSPSTLSDSFGHDAEIPNDFNGTADVTFQLYSDEASAGILGGRAHICELAGCPQVVEDGTFQAASLGITIVDNPITTQHVFNVYLESGPEEVAPVPEPASLYLVTSGLCALLILAGRKRSLRDGLGTWLKKVTS